MKVVFVDAAYWIAIVNPQDQSHKPAKRAREELGDDVRLVTTDEVLAEFLTGLSKYGLDLRVRAAKMVHAIMENPNVKVIPQTRDSFQKGLERYEQRSDKNYSLQDCISMNAMEEESITDILTTDRHFKQEGFAILINSNAT